MNSLTLWKTSTLILAGALAFVTGNQMYEAHADPQPHMVSALASLKAARAQLDNATTDKGGHRKAALQLTDQAIAEVKKGIEFDNAHDKEKNKDKDKKKATESESEDLEPMAE